MPRHGSMQFVNPKHSTPLLITLLLASAGCPVAPAPSELDTQLLALLEINNIDPIEKPAVDQAKVALGQALMFDKELSGNRNISCATCHHPTLNTGDGLSLALGEGGASIRPLRTIPTDANGGNVFIPRNSTPVFNRGTFRTMFWDARVEQMSDGSLRTPAGSDLLPGLDNALAAQAMFPVTSREEMRGQPGDNELADIADDDFKAIWQALMNRILAIADYRTMFAAAFPGVAEEDLTFAHAANAIAAFEEAHWTLDDAPFDDYLRGDLAALSDDAKRGGILFYGDAGCVRCHEGTHFTDEQFHNVGVPPLGPGLGDGDDGQSDFGRERVTGNDTDRYKFRTGTLRNVAATGPWFHNGAFTTLEAAVRHMLDPMTSAMIYNVSQLPEELRDSVGLDELPDILGDLDSRVADPVQLSDAQVAQLIAFLESLTSPSLPDLPGNDVPDSVPSGLPVND